jgi:hypothetical protein
MRREGEDFDRDVAMELGIVCAIDLTHPAFANQRAELVMTEASSNCRPIGQLMRHHADRRE